MNTAIKTKFVGWAKVPHGIVDAAIPDMVKMLLWYCYDKSAAWTFSVAEVARSLSKTPQCIRKHFKTFTAAGVLKNAGERQSKHGKYPIYKFDPAQVDALVKSQLKVNPEMNPETDVETNPDIQDSHTNTDIPKQNTEKDNTKKGNKENDTTKGIDAGDFKKAFADLDSDFKSQAPNPLMKEIKSGPLSKVKFLGEQPPQSAAVAPEHPVNAVPAEGGGSLGIPSMPVVPSAASTIIQAASGKSNADGDANIVQEAFSTRAPIIQPSVNGTANTGAPGTVVGHPGTSAHRAKGTIAKSGVVKGGIPKLATDHAEWKLRQMRQSYPYTEASIAIIEQELLKRLADYNWSIYPAWSDPRQEVNTLLTKLISEFGQRK